jgi:Domain of unknown function (DUF4874)
VQGHQDPADACRERAQAATGRGRRRAILLVLASAALLVWVMVSGGAASDLVTLNYAKSDETIVNPERGFFHQSSECQQDGTTFTGDTLRRYREDEKISLIRCIFYLDKGPTLEAGQIERLQARMEAAREQGFKLIVRFAYTQDELHSPESPNDVPLSTVQSHLTQLAPTLRTYSDVIVAVESGFVGAYGEGAYSEHFGDIGLITDAQ